MTPFSANGYNPYNSANNRLLSGKYDAAGNQTEVGSYSLLYNAENQQTQAVDNVSEGQVSYGYDGFGQRVTKSNNGQVSTVYVYDIFGQLAAEYNSFAAQQTPCSTCYLSYDHLGSVRMVTDGAANVISRHDYLPFGEEIPANTAGRTAQSGPFGDKVNQKFTGQERDEETGFDFFQARYFYGAQGRFNSPDPAGFLVADPTNPQSWNQYSYVWNSPLDAVDPYGLYVVVFGGCSYNATDFYVDGQYDSSSYDLIGCNSGGGGNAPSGGGSGGGGGGGRGEGFRMTFTPTPLPSMTQGSAKPGTQPCVASSLLQRAGIAVQARVANFLNKTIGLGAGGSIGAGNKVGVSLSISRQLVVAPNGQAAFVTSVSTFNGQIFNSFTSKGYGGYGGIQFSISNVSNVNDFRGSALDFGAGGGGGWGGGFDFSTNLQTWQATGTVGGGFGGYSHGLQNVTSVVTPICGG